LPSSPDKTSCFQRTNHKTERNRRPDWARRCCAMGLVADTVDWSEWILCWHTEGEDNCHEDCQNKNEYSSEDQSKATQRLIKLQRWC